MCVVSHHLLARHYTKMVLTDLFGRRQMIGSTTLLELPLPEYGDIYCKKEYGDVRFTIWVKEQ